MGVELQTVNLPDFGASSSPPPVDASEYEARCSALLKAAPDLDWMIVYGDREHSANLVFLSGFDPRFEEAYLVLARDGSRYLIIGNEGLLYRPLAPLSANTLLSQSLSLMGQDRTKSPRLTDVFMDIGLSRGDSVGFVGWKYLTDAEDDEPAAPAFVPAHVVRQVAKITESASVDVTALLMHPSDGLRAKNNARQIAVFEWAATRSSVAVQRIMANSRPGISEYETVAAMEYCGDPLSAHVMFASGKDVIVGLRSPSGKIVDEGDGVSTAIGFWGGLCCRAGLLTDRPDRSFVDSIAKPYFDAIAGWYQEIQIGRRGGEIFSTVIDGLERYGVAFRPLVNPGHQISYEEWLHSPIAPDSATPIQSGMMLQSDIIPYPLPSGLAINCEDTLAVADSELRNELREQFPDLWERIAKRREFMTEMLGLSLPEEVLPLSNMPGYLAPHWLSPTDVCVIV